MPSRSPEARDGLLTGRTVVGSAMRRFLLYSLAAMAVLSVGTVLLSRTLARNDALLDARLAGAQIAEGIAAPLVTAELRQGDVAAVARLSEAMLDRMSDGSVRHVKLWQADGRLLWSDETDLVGRTFDLDADVRELFGTHHSVSELSSLDKAENVEEADEGQLLEVYVGSEDTVGEPFVFEAYITPAQVDESTQAALKTLLPLGLGALLLFQLTVLPLALSLARRVQRGEQHRSELLSASLAHWQSERRRLAMDLHDGVVQDVAGATYALRGVVDALGEDDRSDRARVTGERALQTLDHGLSSLRTVMSDLAPPVAETGLRAAVDALADHARDRDGLAVEVDLPPLLVAELAGDRVRTAAVYRVVREGLRNAAKHAGGRRARVRLHLVDEAVAVRVEDDGSGPGAPAGEGHVGLVLLGDLVRELGGALELRHGDPGAGELSGAVLDARIPLV